MIDDRIEFIHSSIRLQGYEMASMSPGTRSRCCGFAAFLVDVRNFDINPSTPKPEHTFERPETDIPVSLLFGAGSLLVIGLISM